MKQHYFGLNNKAIWLGSGNKMSLLGSCDKTTWLGLGEDPLVSWNILELKFSFPERDPKFY